MDPASCANAILGLSLKTLVDKVSSLNRPSLGNIAMLDFDLADQDLLSNFAAIPANIRSSPHHALVTYDTYSEIVCN